MPPPKHRARPKAKKPGYPQSTIDKALRLLRARKAGEKLSLRAIADQCGVPNPVTILRWSRQRMTEKARCERSARKGPPRKLTTEGEMIAAGWVMYRHGLLVDTTSARFFDFLSRAFDTRPSPAWLTKFKRRWHLSSRITRTSVPAITSRCGMFEGDPEHVMAELVCEGRTLSPADARVANECMLAYMTFKDLTGYSEADEAEAEGRLKGAPVYHVRKRARGAAVAEKSAK